MSDDGRWRRDLRAENIRRILIIKWSGLGDVAIATATMQEIREAFPDATIHLNTMAPCDQLFTDDPRFDEVFCFDLRGEEGGVAGHWRWLRFVRARRYDLVVDLQCVDHTRILLTLLPLAGGWIRHRLSFYRKMPYNLAPDVSPEVFHTRDYAIPMLQAIGVPTRCERPVLHPGERHRANAAALMGRHDLRENEYGVLLPGSTDTGAIKRWGVERYATLAERLHDAGLEKIVIIGGPDEIDECAKIAERCGPWLVNLCGETEILDIVPLCDAARVVVGNDTGTAHVASASTTPMLVIFGPTDPRKSKPLGGNVVALQADLPCINCWLKFCDHHSCMPALTPEYVHGRIHELTGLPLPAGASISVETPGGAPR